MRFHQALLGCTAIVTTLSALSSGAFAIPVTVSGVFGPGDAQQFQVGGGDLQSSLGAAVSLDLSFTYTSDSQGTWTAVLENTSGPNPFDIPGVLADFGIDLKSTFDWHDGIPGGKGPGGALPQYFSASGAGNYFDATANGAGPSEIGAGFFLSKINPPFMLAADTSIGLATGQSVTLSWPVTGSGFDGHTQLSDFLDVLPVDVASGETPFEAFWVANFDDIGQLQRNGKGQLVVTEGDTNIGGFLASPVPSSVPEPITLATFGTGLIGLAGLRRRAKR